MRRSALLILIIFFAAIFPAARVRGEDEPLPIAVITAEEYSAEGNVFKGSLKIDIPEEFYNDGLKISWHTENEKGDVIIFENERIPLTGGEMELRADINRFFAENPDKTGVIAFDIVDEAGGFWFSVIDEVECDFPRITVPRDDDAAENYKPDASVELISSNFEGAVFTGKVRVDIAERLRNDSQQLSYHILDGDGNMISYENQRYPLTDLPADITVRAELPAGSAVLAFDIVDEDNVFWFSGVPYLCCNFTSQAVPAVPEPPVEPEPPAVPEPPLTGSEEITLPKVVITHDGEAYTNNNKLSLNMQVKFGDPALYNAGVKLSYKLYTTDMTPISEENERYPLNFDGDTGRVHMDIELPDNRKDMRICFDLVDETNLYWFGKSQSLTLNSADIVYEYSFGQIVKNQYAYIFGHQIIQLLICIAGFAGFICAFIKIRKMLSSEEE